MENVIIRNEAEHDIDVITEVTAEAFKTLEVSNQTEHLIIEALRKAGALTVSLVAELDREIVGHIAFSPVSISDGTAGWYGLGPVSVLPEYHKQGIGKALINEGLEKLKKLGAKGCTTVGHPDYYPKFGFANSSKLTLEGVPPEVFFVLSFNGTVPEGAVSFHKAFTAGM